MKPGFFFYALSAAAIALAGASLLAVINGHTALVQRLLALGANPALVDQGGMNALQHARQRGRGDIAALIEAAQ